MKQRFVYLAAALTLYYFVVMLCIHFFADPEQLLFRYASDSQGYLQVADWLWGGSDGHFISLRTYFYPLLLGLVYFSVGSLGIWFMQMLMWLASGLILYANFAKLLPGKTNWHRAFILLYCACLTPIYLSTMVLTETLSMFLISLATLIICQYWRTQNLHRSIPALALITALLMVTKPNFQFVHIGLVGFFLLVVWRLRLGGQVLLHTLIVSLVPILIQFGLNYRESGVLAFSRIGSYVLRVSLYTQLQAQLQDREFEEVLAEVKAAHPTFATMIATFVHHPWTTATLLNKNLSNNVRLVLHLKENPDPWEHFWRRRLNDFFYWLHLAFLLPVLFCFYLSLRLKRESDWRFILLTIIFAGGFLPTSVSFWAADRWAAPFIVLWPLLYILAFLRTREHFFERTKIHQ